jgi:hypothetical protein
LWQGCAVALERYVAWRDGEGRRGEHGEEWWGHDSGVAGREALLAAVLGAEEGEVGGALEGGTEGGVGFGKARNESSG